MCLQYVWTPDSARVHLLSNVTASLSRTFKYAYYVEYHYLHECLMEESMF